MVDGKYTVISTFAGGGGSSLGYQMAGYKELLAIEWEDNAVETLKLNFPNIPIWQRDIRTVTSKEILEFTGLNPNDLDIFDGSPPCQGFSTSGKRNVRDERNDLFKDYTKLVDGLQPKVFVMENVSGMIKGKMRGYFIEIINTLKAMNYEVKAKLMNTMYYNVPQSRERLIFIGIRKDLNIFPSYPIPNSKLISVKEALIDCPIGINCYLSKDTSTYKLLSKCKQGQSVQKIHIKGHYFNFRRLSLNDVSPTIIKNAGNQLFHPIDDRFLYDTEVKRLCSFPDSYLLVGGSKRENRAFRKCSSS